MNRPFRFLPFVFCTIVVLVFLGIHGSALSNVQAEQIPSTSTPPFFETPVNMPPTPIPFQPSELSRTATAFISAKYGVPIKNLVVINEHQRNYPLTSKRYISFVLLDSRSPSSPEYSLLLDMSTSEIQEDYDAVEKAEQEAYFAKYGKLHPALYEKLQSSDDKEVIPVAFWVAHAKQELSTNDLYNSLAIRFPDAARAIADGQKPMEVADPDLSEQIQNAYRLMVNQEVKKRVQPLVDWLTNSKAKYAPLEGMPVLFAHLPKTDILSLTNREDVAIVYLADVKETPAMDTAASTDRVPVLWAQNITGTGRSVAVLEGTNIDRSLTCLNHASIVRPATSGVGDHATRVGSIVGCNADPHRGIAYGALIYSAGTNGTDTDTVAGLQWAIQTPQNVEVVNISVIFGSDNYLNFADKAFDYWARFENATIVTAAGNSGGSLGSPAKAWNVITVGASNNSDTSNWADDTMWVDSSWVNPANGDREKPEIVAPGYNITPGGIGSPQSGTSFAAPQVAGLAALLMQRNSTLIFWPQAVKAIIMASAVHNIIGPSDIPTGQDLKDGAGSIDGVLADSIAQTGFLTNTICNKPCWWGTGTSNTNPNVTDSIYRNFKASRGERIRVAIAWFAQADPPGASYANDALLTNYNLYVYAPSGALVGYTASTNNNYELADFTATETGQYQIRVYRSAWGDQNEPSNSLAIAWVSDSTYLTDLRNNVGGDAINSVFFIRNESPVWRNVKVNYFNATGGIPGGTGVDTCFLGPNTQCGIMVNDPNRIPNGTTGSAIIDSGEGISVALLQQTFSWVDADNTGIPNTGNPAYGQTTATGPLYAPSIYSNNANMTSTLNLANTGPVSASVTINFYSRSGSPNYTWTGTLAANGRTSVSAPSVVGSGSWVGSAKISTASGSQSVAAQVTTQLVSVGAINTHTYNASAGGNAALYAPVTYKNIDNLNTRLVVENVGTGSTTVSLSFYNQDGSLRTTYSLSTINASRAKEVGLSSIVGIPAGWSGSLKITSSGQPLSAVIRTDSSAGGRSAYNAIWRPSGNIYLPFAAKGGFFGINSTFIVQNTGNTSCSVTSYYYEAFGSEIVAARETFTLAANASTVRPQIVNGNLAGGWNGSIVLQSSCNSLLAVLQDDMTNSISTSDGVGK